MHNLLLPFHQKRQLKRKNFTNFIKSNILNKSIKRWLFLFFVCLSPPGQLRTFTMSSIQFSAWLFEQVQKHCTSPIVSSRHEISLQLEYQNPEQKLVQRNSFFFVFDLLDISNFKSNWCKYIKREDVTAREWLQIFVYNKAESQHCQRLHLEKKKKGKGKFGGGGRNKEINVHNRSSVFVISPILHI